MLCEHSLHKLHSPNRRFGVSLIERLSSLGVERAIQKGRLWRPLYGSSNWARTSDPLINSQMLCQLSYGRIFMFFHSEVSANLRRSPNLAVESKSLIWSTTPMQGQPKFHIWLLSTARFGTRALCKNAPRALRLASVYCELWKNMFLKKEIIRQRSTLPGSHPPSTIDAIELNFCVRYGNRWILNAITTGFFSLFSSGLHPQN